MVFDLMPRWALLILLVVTAAWGGFNAISLERSKAAHASDRASYANALAKSEQIARETTQRFRERELDLAQRMSDDAQRTEAELSHVRSVAANAVSAGQRLRNQLSALARTSCGAATEGTAIDHASQATSATADLLADVHRRLDEAADGIAQHADQARIAGAACERAYERAVSDLGSN